MTRPGTKKPK
ncbi:hypothetical protein VULLAG_LOCUS12905 [Vulpes lagopus]